MNFERGVIVRHPSKTIQKLKKQGASLFVIKQQLRRNFTTSKRKTREQTCNDVHVQVPFSGDRSQQRRMIALTILSLYLLLLFVLVTLSLLISLLFLAWWRRRFRRETSTAAPSEMSTEPYKSPSKEMLYYFCWKNQARVEPAGAWPSSDTESPTKMQEAEDFDKLYSRSRILYTINEEKETETETEVEEERYISEETESFHGGTETGIDGYGLADLDIENDPQQFYSPLSSPQFYTPYSSPSRGRSPEREAAEVSGMPEVRLKIPSEKQVSSDGISSC